MNESELRKKVEKKVGELTNSEWDNVKPRFGLPYEEYDFEDCIKRAKDMGLYPRHVDKEILVDYPPLWYEKSKKVAEQFKSRAEAIRNRLGLLKPLKLTEIDSWIKKTSKGEFVVGDENIALFYYSMKKLTFPEELVYSHGFKECFSFPSKCNESVLIQSDKKILMSMRNNIKKNGPEEIKNFDKKIKPLFNQKITPVLSRLFMLKEEATRLVNKTGWNGAEAVTFLLCDKTPLLPYITVTKHLVFSDNLHEDHAISIRVGSLDVPADAIRKIYLSARKELLSSYGKKETRPARRRDYTKDLIELVHSTPNMKWEERFKLLKDNPYKTSRNMAQAYSRAKKRYSL